MLAPVAHDLRSQPPLAEGSKRARILVVDDDPTMIQALAQVLSGVGCVRFATTGDDALRLAREEPPDIVLLDAEMPGMSGFEACEAFKADPALSSIPVIFVTSHGTPAFELAGFERGAADFIAKPISLPLVLARVRTHLRLKQATDELRRLSAQDELTGVANRRRFTESLRLEWARVSRAGGCLSVLLIDVDHFKMFNDHFGHPAGDACLREVARALTQACQRQNDLVARYGGEEFVVLLPATPREGAAEVAARLLARVNALAMPHPRSPTAGHVTVSVGVATVDGRGPSTAPPGGRLEPALASREDAGRALVEAADRALYEAKASGRNRVCFAAHDEVAGGERARRGGSAPEPDEGAPATALGPRFAGR